MYSNFPFKKNSAKLSRLKDKSDSDYDFSSAINLFKSQRSKLGISLEELSNKTKISKNVLIAIENGWDKSLPEKTYLISILKRLEIELNLEEGSLKGILLQKVIVNNISKLQLKFINIDFLNSWIGNLIYFISMLLSILVLNIQQRNLLKINSITIEPISINEIDKGDEANMNKNE